MYKSNTEDLDGNMRFAASPKCDKDLFRYIWADVDVVPCRETGGFTLVATKPILPGMLIPYGGFVVNQHDVKALRKNPHPIKKGVVINRASYIIEGSGSDSSGLQLYLDAFPGNYPPNQPANGWIGCFADEPSLADEFCNSKLVCLEDDPKFQVPLNWPSVISNKQPVYLLITESVKAGQRILCWYGWSTTIRKNLGYDSHGRDYPLEIGKVRSSLRLNGSKPSKDPYELYTREKKRQALALQGRQREKNKKQRRSVHMTMLRQKQETSKNSNDDDCDPIDIAAVDAGGGAEDDEDNGEEDCGANLDDENNINCSTATGGAVVLPLVGFHHGINSVSTTTAPKGEEDTRSSS